MKAVFWKISERQTCEYSQWNPLRKSHRTAIPHTETPLLLILLPWPPSSISSSFILFPPSFLLSPPSSPSRYYFTFSSSFSFLSSSFSVFSLLVFHHPPTPCLLPFFLLILPVHSPRSSCPLSASVSSLSSFFIFFLLLAVLNSSPFGKLFVLNSIFLFLSSSWETFWMNLAKCLCQGCHPHPVSCKRLTTSLRLS